MDFYSYYGLNRTACDVLDEMRKFDIAKNYSSLGSLIEELQSMVNRMESGLQDFKDFENLQAELKAGRKEFKKLKRDLKAAQAKLGDLKNV